MRTETPKVGMFSSGSCARIGAMRNTARYASFIALASAACVVSAQEQPKQPTAQGPNFYSVASETRGAEAAAVRIEQALPVVESEALDAYFRQLVGDQEFRIVVYREAPRGLQAGPFAMPLDGFANPGAEPVAMRGTIFVNAQMLAGSDEAAFAKKIAHAIAHVSLRHATKFDTKTQIAAVTPAVFMGGDIRPEAGAEIPLLWMRMLARRDEAEADQASVEILAGLHLDAAGFARAQAAAR